MTGSTPAIASTVPDLREVRRRVEAVPDPELPVLTLGQLGVIRDVRTDGSDGSDGSDGEVGAVVVEITPTYSGCPAMEVISSDVAAVVVAAGYRPQIRLVLSPPWSTDWITSEGRKALSEAGIAPPGPAPHRPVSVQLGRSRAAAHQPACPQCGSAEVEELARFGSTSCKALWRCRTCAEPFDYVKPL